NCAPTNVGSDVTLTEFSVSPSTPAPGGGVFVSVKPSCQSWETWAATNGVTANQPNVCLAPTSSRPLARLLPKLPVANSVGPTPAIVRLVSLRNVLKLIAPAA